MQEEERIQFEQIFDDGWTRNNQGNENPSTQSSLAEDKEYDSLYDELVDKCNPINFNIESVGIERFNIANEIYAQVLNNHESEEDLVYLRNRAMDELGIHISTSKVFNRLKEFLDPQNYMNRHPYDVDLVRNAGTQYDKLIRNRDDIRALSELENESLTMAVKDEYDYSKLDADDYIRLHPQGKYVNEAKEYKRQQQEQEELKCFKETPVESYLNRYPQGRYVEEALFYKNNSAKKYMERYPNGRYYYNAWSKRRDSVISAIIIFVFFFLIFMFSLETCSSSTNSSLIHEETTTVDSLTIIAQQMNAHCPMSIDGGKGLSILQGVSAKDSALIFKMKYDPKIYDEILDIPEPRIKEVLIMSTFRGVDIEDVKNVGCKEVHWELNNVKIPTIVIASIAEVEELQKNYKINPKAVQRRILETEMKIENATLPVTIDEGMKITKGMISGNNVVVTIKVDENLYSIDDMKKSRENAKLIMLSGGDEAEKLTRRKTVEAGLGLIYRTVGDKSGKTFDIVITNAELKKSISN